MSPDRFDELLQAQVARSRQEDSDKIDRHVERLRNAHLPADVTLGDEDEQALRNYLRRCMTVGSDLCQTDDEITRQSVIFATSQCVERCDPHLATMVPDLRSLSEKAVVRGIRHARETDY